MAGPKTPVMQQHALAKRAYPDAVLFFRLGDFYEMFGDDAVLVSKLLDLTLTSRNKGKADEVPMAGVPHHAAEGYIARLLGLGHKVAICEQMADPAKTRGIVPREVVRVITPGLVTDADQLDRGHNNWLAAIEFGDTGAGLGLLDLSTGELLTCVTLDAFALASELGRAAPREVLLGGSFAEDARALIQSVVGPAPLRLEPPLDAALLEQALGELAPEAARLEPLARAAAGRALAFARACNPGKALPVRRIARVDPSTSMAIDQTAQRHLELCVSASGQPDATLLSVIDATETAVGKRLLRRRLLAPLTDVARIRRRLDRVEAFVVHARLRSALRAELAQVTDLERLAVRANLGQSSARDLARLRDGLAAAAAAVQLLEAVTEPELRVTLGLGEAPLDTVEELRGLLARALVERPPAQAKEGALFRPGFDAELDEFADLSRTGAEQMVALEAKLREQTQIPSLKVRYTRVFGWYVEVTRAHAGKVPAHFRRKQTVATAERYTLDELDELADRITHADERHRERELALLEELVSATSERYARVTHLAALVARWDVACALAEVAHRHDYARPEVDDSERIELGDGRHPVVERLSAQGRFVPNDVALDAAGQRLWLITGPNMAGKSTLLRQVALTAILAQMGSFVPARRARIGVVDRVLSRVGASDDVARGESTFMVEMRETAEILRVATRRSLVILDEIGRGTSTFDGLAIAWAVAEHLDDAIGCRALFATHYHELTAYADGSPHAANYSVSAREVAGDVVFLHRLVPGPASRSYGIAVAKLAGLPESVLARASAVLGSLESGRAAHGPAADKPHAQASQLALFEAPATPRPAEREVLETLRAADVHRLTPIDALNLVARLREKL
ncbi:MAG: DNA mismatch repair protein MutS [Polyangiaceae bacterium]|nr:DNA mismatch repair protein MutS [Polyangiaceae bacterium]